MKVLEAIDIYGVPFNFTINNKLQHTTYIGGLLTIITIICLLESVVYFGQDFYLRQNPLFFNSRTQLQNYPIYDLTSDNFMFGFRIEDNNRNLWNESHYFSFKVTYNNYTTIAHPNGTYTPNGLITNLNFSLCNKDLLINLGFDVFLDSKNFYCVDFNNSSPISIGGYWDSNITKYIDVQLVLCSQDPNKKECATVNDTLNLLNNRRPV